MYEIEQERGKEWVGGGEEREGRRGGRESVGRERWGGGKGVVSLKEYIHAHKQSHTHA